MSITLQHPLPGAPISARFGWRPAFTENGTYVPAMLHNGVDFAAQAGTIICAAHAGRVTYVGWDDLGGGWMVKVSSARFSTLYLHNRERSPLVKVGDEVRAGQPVAYVGMSGTATGPHLHFMLRLDGMDVDPLPYLHSTPAPPAPKGEPMPKSTRITYRPTDGIDVADSWTYLTINAALDVTVLHGGPKGRHAQAYCNVDARGRVDVRALVERTSQDGREVVESRPSYWARIDTFGTYVMPLDIPAGWRLRFQARAVDAEDVLIEQVGYVVDYWEQE